MSQVNIFNRTFLRGLETTRDADGAADWGGFRRFKNTRVGKDEAERRGGMRVVATVPEVGSSAQFAGTAGVAVGLVDAWALTEKAWALDFVVDPDGDGTLLDAGSIKITRSSSLWTVEIGTAILSATWANVVQHIAVTSDGESYRLLVEGVVIDSIPYVAPPAQSSTISIGGMAVALDFLRLRVPGPASWKARRLRLLNPRARGVLCCYRDAQDESDILWDHSIYEAHLRCSNMSAPAGRLLPERHTPVQGIDTYVDENDKRRLFIVAGGKEYDAPYA